jgi:hypothetical protein
MFGLGPLPASRGGDDDGDEGEARAEIGGQPPAGDEEEQKRADAGEEDGGVRIEA